MELEKALEKASRNPPPPRSSDDSFLMISIDYRGSPRNAVVKFDISRYKGKLPAKKFESFYVAKLGEDSETVTFGLISGDIKNLMKEKKELLREFLGTVWAYTYWKVGFTVRKGVVYVMARLPPTIMCRMLRVNCSKELAGKRLLFPVMEAEAITYNDQVIGIAVTVKVKQEQ